MLPSRAEFGDFSDRLVDAVVMLAQLYETEPATIAHNIAHWNRDLLKMGIESPAQEEQLLPLNYATEVIAKYRDFVSYAAATESDPRRFFARQTQVGRAYAEGCMFGHTFVGSFGLTVECPLTITPEFPQFGPATPPFERRVTQRIAVGLCDIASAVRSDDPDVIVQDHTAGFSGNMCEVLAEVFEISEGRNVYQKVVWAPELAPTGRAAEIPPQVSIDKATHRVLVAAAASLQTVDEPDVDKTIIGRVTFLKSEEPPLAKDAEIGMERTVAVLWQLDKGQAMHIRLSLNAEQYVAALDAHRSGRKISVLGKPRKEGKYWHLLAHHDFRVV